MAGRTFFIPANTRTATAAEQIVVVDPPKPVLQIVGFCDFIGELSELPTKRQRYVKWLVANQLNNSIISAAQAHLKQQRFLASGAAEVNESIDYMREAGVDQQTIDTWNELQAAMEELVENNNARYEQGFEKPVDPLDTLNNLAGIRAAIAMDMAVKSLPPVKEPAALRAEILAGRAKLVKREQAQPVVDSLAYRVRLEPKVDERKIMELHLATEIPLDVLRATELKLQISARKQLVADAPLILELANAAHDDHDHTTIDDVDELFMELPAQTRYRLIGGVCRALNQGMAEEVKLLLRGGRLDSATNRVLIKAVFDGYVQWFNDHAAQYAEELAEYEERGWRLKTLEEFLAEREAE